MSIEKMSDEEIIENYKEMTILIWDKDENATKEMEDERDKYKNELLKRLSKNNIENKKLNWDGWKDPKQEAEKAVKEFKNKLLKEIENDVGLQYDCGECNDKNTIIGFINNLI